MLAHIHRRLDRGLVFSVAVNLSAAVALALVGFLSTIFMAQRMTLEDFGLAMVLLITFNAISALDGLRPVVIYEYSHTDSGQDELLHLSRLISATLAAVVGAITMTACIFLADDRLGVGGSALFAVALALYFPMSVHWGVLDAQGNTAFTGAMRSFAWIVMYCLFAALVFHGAPMWCYAAGLAGMNVTLLAVFAQRVMPRARGTASVTITMHRLGGLFRQCLNNIAFNLSALLLGSLDRIALATTGGVTAVGLYSGAYEIATKPAALFRVISLVLVPQASRAHAAGTDETCTWIRVTTLMFWAVCSAVALAVPFRRDVLLVLVGEKFVDAADAFGLLLIGFSFVVLGYACAILLNARGNFTLQRKCYGAAAIAMLIGAWPLAGIGVMGAALLYMLSRFVDPVLLFFSARLVNALPKPLTAILIVATYVGLMVSAWRTHLVLATTLAVALGYALRRWDKEVCERSAGPR